MVTNVLINGSQVNVQPIRKKLYDERDLDIGLLVPELVEKTLTEHVTRARLTDLDEYVSLLDQDGAEYESLLRDLLPSPNRFFEDPAFTELLYEDILPDILRQKHPGEPVRIWVTHSGDGYLAYDIALMLLRLTAEMEKPPPLRVIATFDDAEAAGRARWRDYPLERFYELEASWLHIGRTDQSLRWARNIIVFGIHDLITQTAYTNVDLVVCAGYLPLLTGGKRDEVTGKLIHSLQTHGYLVLGRGEIPVMGVGAPTEEQPIAKFHKQLPHPYELKRGLSVPSGLMLAPEDLLDKFADPVLIVDRKNIILCANEQARRVFFNNGNLEGRSMEELEPKELLSSVADAIDRGSRVGLGVISAEDADWTAGIAPVANQIGGAVAAIALISNNLCTTDNLTEAGTLLDCPDRAIKTAELAEEAWVHQSQIGQLVTQAAMVTESLYRRNEQLAAMHEEMERRNAELFSANDRLKLALEDRARAEENLRRAFDREHHIAETLQRALLPAIAERVDGYLAAVKYEAAAEEAEVGGDFYHSAMIDPYRYIMALGDVAGKGLEAAVMGAMTKYMLVGFSTETPDPGIILMRVNEALATHTSDEGFAFVTLAVVLLDLRTHTVYYSSAGHEPGILYRSAERNTEMLEPTGKALGIVGGNEYGTTELSMEPGDLLMLYTDGIPDAGVPDNALGAEGLARAVKRGGSKPPAQLLEDIYKLALKYGKGRLRDDAASLILKREV